jgi:hypothetical protein
MQRIKIAAGDLVARLDLVIENLQLLDQDRGLHGVQSRGQAEADVVVFLGALPVNANAAQALCEIGVVGENRAAVAVAAERLCGKEAGRRGKTERAELAALVGGAERLCGVVQHKQVFASATSAMAS